MDNVSFVLLIDKREKSMRELSLWTHVVFQIVLSKCCTLTSSTLSRRAIVMANSTWPFIMTHLPVSMKRLFWEFQNGILEFTEKIRIRFIQYYMHSDLCHTLTTTLCCTNQVYRGEGCYTTVYNWSIGGGGTLLLHTSLSRFLKIFEKIFEEMFRVTCNR